MNYSLEEQEAHYARIGQMGRAVDWAGKSFDEFDLRPFLEQVLPALRFPAPRPRVLEYGTGTGPGACFLAARGFRVVAIDISPTAIGLARRFAADRGCDIDFRVADIRNFGGPPGVYDLVIDNFCLHCIAADSARQSVFRTVRSALKPGGFFLIGTALHREDRDLGEQLHDPDTGTVYRRLPSRPTAFAEAVYLSGNWYVPRRRYVRADALRAELERAGFEVVRQEGGRVLCTVGGP